MLHACALGLLRCFANSSVKHSPIYDIWGEGSVKITLVYFKTLHILICNFHLVCTSYLYLGVQFRYFGDAISGMQFLFGLHFKKNRTGNDDTVIFLQAKILAQKFTPVVPCHMMFFCRVNS